MGLLVRGYFFSWEYLGEDGERVVITEYVNESYGEALEDHFDVLSCRKAVMRGRD